MEENSKESKLELVEVITQAGIPAKRQQRLAGEFVDGRRLLTVDVEAKVVGVLVARSGLQVLVPGLSDCPDLCGARSVLLSILRSE